MTTLQLTHAPILNSSAQVLILPVNTASIFLDPVLMRTKTLYPDNYQRYHRACRDGSLEVGSCLLHKRVREQAGLSASHNGNQPIYVANLTVSDHPYHPARSQWLKAALIDLQQQLIPLIRYQGVRKVALLARPLIFDHSSTNIISKEESSTNSLPLDWQTFTLPLITQYLQHLPKLRTEVHVPRSVPIAS
ncbi:hypothetical protein [uncultured Psychrobacter sp.]|uniref:hypothetical protein n=1 Tax=uncultured Psychrobacter sp. TaxID=259303 RepID=UPI00345ADE54